MKITIATKLFLGFLVIICLNAFFVLVVSRLSSLNIIASILKRQNKAKNTLLRLENLHAKQGRSRLIYGRIGKDEFAENFKKTGAQTIVMIDSILYNLKVILELDSIVSEKHGYDPELLALIKTVNNNIVKHNSDYNRAFSEFVTAKKAKYRSKSEKAKNLSKKRLLNEIIDTAGTKLKAGLLVTDSLIEYQTVTRIKEIEERIDNVTNLTQLILLGMSIFSILFALIISRLITNSLRRLKESASNIAKGDFDFNPRGYPKDEIGDLANAFFDMAYDLKRTQEELIKKRRLAAIGEIVASVNHEINNPLMIISGNAQFLEMTLESGVTKDTKERIRAIIEETERISQVTKKLRDIKNPIVEDYTSSGEQMINLDKSID